MLQGVIYLEGQDESRVARLQMAGLHAAQCSSQEDAAAAVKAWGCLPEDVLTLGGSVYGCRCWTDVAQQDDDACNSSIPSSDRVMQAIVQHNRQSILAAPAAAAPAPVTETSDAVAGGEQLQQQHQQCKPHAPPLLVVGYVMKASREQQLAGSGLLHLLPVDGVCFMPFDVSRLQQHQGHIDVLLHKGSDELVVGPDGGVMWSDRLLELQAWLQQHPDIVVVDPFEHTAKVLDRLVLSRLLDQLQELQLPHGVRARAPRWLTLPNAADGPALRKAVLQAGLQAPFIIKPVVACGLSHSHSMALVLSEASLPLAMAQLPLPAVVQEFVNHGGQQFKVYVLGETVFVTPRASIPDVHADPSLPMEQQLHLFDSLASLPTQLPLHMTQQQQQHLLSNQQIQQPDMAALQAVAAFLRQQLGLTLFGFDVVVASERKVAASLATSCQQGAAASPSLQQQELVVIDVNYFPNYRGGSNAPELFRAALKQRWWQQQLLPCDGAAAEPLQSAVQQQP